MAENRDYELTLVIQPGLDDEGVRKVLDDLANAIVASGGQVNQVGQLRNGSGEVVDAESWKKRRLAYPIRRFNEGYYAVLRMTASPEFLDSLDRSLRLNEAVLRHLLVRAGT